MICILVEEKKENKSKYYTNKRMKGFPVSLFAPDMGHLGLSTHDISHNCFKLKKIVSCHGVDIFGTKYEETAGFILRSNFSNKDF